MSYTVLAVKWRPRRFDQLVGQSHVVTALMNALEAERVHHAYLFSGTRGVGKTTIARILAKALNCENGVSAEPCGECSACASIDEGRFVDLIEVDAASKTKVDDTRELLDNVQYMPTRGRYKVYLIDEVHMLSNHSFNALLKTLEEPPPHVKFLFATTDPQKLPVTVLSRCLQFNLKKLPLGLIQGQLKTICDAEPIAAEELGIAAIARAANGSMRDGLSLLDQAVAFGGGKVAESDVSVMLGSIDRSHVTTMLELLAAQDGAGLLDQVASLDENAPDYAAVLDELMAALQKVAIAQLVDAGRLEDDDARLRDLAGQMLAEDVQLYFQIALNGRRDIEFTRHQRIGFEMTLMRMLAFKLDEGPGARGGSARRGRTATASPAGSSGDSARPQSKRPAVAGRRPAATADEAPGKPATSGRPRPAATEAAGSGPALALDDAVSDWDGLLRASGLKGPVVSLAEHCSVASVQGDRLELRLAAEKSDFNTDKLRERLRSGLSHYLGTEIRLTIQVGTPVQATPAEIQRDKASRQRDAARQAIEQDPTVRAVQAAFDAVLEPDSIEPVSKPAQN